MNSKLDIRTLILVVTLILICRALLMGYLCKLDRSYSPAKYWAIGSSSMALGAVLLGLRGSIPENMSVVLAQSLIILGWMSVSGGTLIAIGRQVPWAYGFLLTAIAIAGAFWLLNVTPDFPKRTLVTSIPIVLFDLYVAVNGFLHSEGRKSQTVFLIAALSLVQGISRAIYTWHIFSTQSQFLFDPSWPVAQYFVVMVITTLICTVLFAMLAMQTTVLNVINVSQDGFWINDFQGRLTEVNAAYCKMIGYSRNELLRMRITDIEANEEPAETAKHVEKIMRTGSDSFETRHRHKDGRIIDVEVTVDYSIANGGLFYVFLRDISERKRLETEIKQLAYYDPLTQLPNRRMLYDRMRLAMSASKRSGQYGVVMLLDLDNFKPANDQYGHDAGDKILVEVSNRISNAVREIDTVARLGGDEFVVLINELNTDLAESEREARNIAEKIRTVLDSPYELTLNNENEEMIQVTHHCTATIGVTLFLGDRKSLDEIITSADSEMYKAKELGRNQIRVGTSPELA